MFFRLYDIYCSDNIIEKVLDQERITGEAYAKSFSGKKVGGMDESKDGVNYR